MNIIIEEIVSEIPVLITEEVFQITIADATSYFDLIEVADTDFVGKDGFVPVVDEATGKLVLQEQQSGPGGGLQLGETSSTAYRGDRGKTAYDHSQATGNPHGTTASEVGAYTKAETDNLINENVVVTIQKNTDGQFSFPHGTVKIGSKFYIGTRQGATSKLLRYNGTTLEESITIPCTANIGIESLCTDGTRLYGIRHNSGISYIFDCNPNDFTDIQYNVISGVNLLGSPAIVTDGTYIYGVENTTPTCKFFKVRISDWTTITTNTWISIGGGHGGKINIDDNVAYFSSQNGYFAKINLSDLSYSELDLTTYLSIITDDLAFCPAVGNSNFVNYVVVGGEYKDNTTGKGGVLINADDMTVIEFNLLPTYGLFFNNDYSKLYNTSNIGFIEEIDFENFIFNAQYGQKYTKNTYTFRQGGVPNEMFFNADNEPYCTNWGTSGNIFKIDLTPKSNPLITELESYYRNVDNASVSYVNSAISNVNSSIGNINTNSTHKDTVKLSENISKGQAVYISGANGTNIIVSKASNATESTSSKTLGLLETTGVTNDIVNVVTDGLLSGLNTSSATIGDAVWLGVNGNLIFGLANKPVAPAHLVYIGIVSRVHATQGEIIIKVQNGFELSEIHDVLLTSKTNEDFLQYDSTTGLWKNFQISVEWLRSKLDSIYTTSSAVATQISNALSSYVPTTRTVNGKALSTNITISSSDVGAPSGSGSSTGTNTGDQDLSGLATKSMGAYSFRVNNTNATANSTEKTYKSLGKQTYSLSPTWTGTTAPTTPNHSYSIQIVDNFCKGSIWLVYGTAGTLVSQVVIPFTSDMPNPVNPNGLTTALDIIGVCTATMRGTNNSAVTLLINGFIRINAAGTGYEFVVNGNAAGYKNVLVSFEYPTS